MDHAEASMLGATERYLLGGLDDEQTQAFEAHFFECGECADDVRTTAVFLEAARPLLAEPGKPSARASASAGTLPFPGRRGWAAGMSGLAAVLCLAAYQGLVVIPRLEREVRSLDTLRAVPSYFLTLTRSEAPIVVVGAADRHVALTLSRSWDEVFPFYRCELQDASGHALLTETVPSRAPKDELEVLLPVRDLPEGPYALVVEGVDSSSASRGSTLASQRVARYPFMLDHEQAAR